MEDNIFVNIVAYAIVGAFALVIVFVVLALGMWVIGKIMKSAAKDMPSRKMAPPSEQPTTKSYVDNNHGDQFRRNV